MAHHTAKSTYEMLTDRLNRFPQDAPPSASLYKILKLLFSEREAALVADLPIKPFTAAQAVRIWKLPEAEARRVLDALADRAILLDTLHPDGRQTYVLSPPMAGFFEFSMMRVCIDVDQKALAELFYQYLNVEEDFIRSLMTHGETQLGRVFVNEPVLSNENALQVLDYERASPVVRTALHIGVGVCYCRHKMQHMGRDCKASKDICLTPPHSRHGYRARPVAEPDLRQPGPIQPPRHGRHSGRHSEAAARAADLGQPPGQIALPGSAAGAGGA